MLNSAVPRHHMIDGQLEPNRVLDPAVVAAMGAVEREQFVPDSYKGAAYVDEAIPLGKDRFLVSPLITAHLLQAADLQPDHKVLIIAAATGYSAALAHRIGCEVVALEESQDLANRARQTLTAMGLRAIQVITSALQNGAVAHAPFDRIIIEGCVPAVAPRLAEQLVDGGVIVLIETRATMPMQSNAYGSVVKLVRQGDALSRQVLFETMAPLLPNMTPKSGFKF